MAPKERAPSDASTVPVGGAPQTDPYQYHYAPRRKYTVYISGLVLTLIALILIVAIIITLLLVEGKKAQIILPVLLVLLAVVAICSFAFIRWQHSKAVQRRNQTATEWIHRTVSQQQLAQQRQEEQRQQRSTSSSRTSWAFWRKYSSGSNRPTPTAPPASTNTSITNQNAPVYTPVTTDIY